MTIGVVKFTSNDLDGYGFDVAADRVVRFNKHPDGTYLNTRATYYINRKTVTHMDLRKTALSQNVPTDKPKSYNRKKFIIIAAILVVIFALTECSVEFKSDVNINTVEKNV